MCQILVWPAREQYRLYLTYTYKGIWLLCWSFQLHYRSILRITSIEVNTHGGFPIDHVGMSLVSRLDPDGYNSKVSVSTIVNMILSDSLSTSVILFPFFALYQASPMPVAR